jgi:peptidoglycan/xylan/chitin deacetylase (PgdA/CDA1 family)
LCVRDIIEPQAVVDGTRQHGAGAEGRGGLPRLVGWRMHDRLIVLMYHDVSASDSDRGYTVSVRALDAVLAVARVETDGGIPCQLTFDDGHLGTYLHALPLLTASGVAATLFVTVRFLGLPGFMDAAMVREWHALGQRVGSHALTHRPLTAMDERDATIELRESKLRLEDMIGAPVTEFAFPGGNESRRVRELAFAAGYSRLHTSAPSFARADGRVVPRFVMRSGTPVNAVAALRSGRIPMAFAGDVCRWALRRSLGDRAYEAICYSVRPSTLPNVT